MEEYEIIRHQTREKNSTMHLCQEIIKDLESIEKYYEEMSKPNVDRSFRIPKIFDTQNLKDQINSKLKD